MSQNSFRTGFRGRSFRKQDLKSADFSGADIRGVDFTGAILTEANFSHAETGIQTHWVTSIAIGSLLVSALSGFIIGYANALIVSSMIHEGVAGAFSGIAALVILVVFLVVILRRGLGAAMGASAVAMASATAIVAAAATVEAGEAVDIFALTILLALAIAGAIAGVAIEALALAITQIVFNNPAMSLIGAALGAVPGAWEGTQYQNQSPITDLIIAGGLSLVPIFLSLYVGWHALAGDEKYSLIRWLAVSISTRKGTCFKSANLTNASFVGATLRHADLRGATLIRTCWYHSKKLDLALVEGTYLENPQVRQLVVTGNGRGQKFEHLDLRGLNLQSADLEGASFLGANLSEATLRHANLTKANLTQTQLYRAHLTQAILTGAYIQDWGISPETLLDEIQCRYVYMRLPTEDEPDPWRKPDNRKEEFQDGDFSDFIAPIIRTLDLYSAQNIDPRALAETFKILDLYHHEGIDPTAATIALKQLAEKHPEAELKVVVLEGRGEDKIRLGARIAANADTSKLNEEYFHIYGKNKSLPYSDLQEIITGFKNEHIHSLENLLTTALKAKPGAFYAKTYYNMGDTTMIGEQPNITAGNSSFINTGEMNNMTGSTINLGQISGAVNNTIGQLEKTEDPEALQLAELVKKLKEAIEADSSGLSDKDKEKALKHLDSIGKLGNERSDPNLRERAETALDALPTILKHGPGLIRFIETHFQTHLDAIFGAIRGILGL